MGAGLRWKVGQADELGEPRDLAYLFHRPAIYVAHSGDYGRVIPVHQSNVFLTNKCRKLNRL